MILYMIYFSGTGSVYTDKLEADIQCENHGVNL